MSSALLQLMATRGAAAAAWDPSAGGNLIWRFCPRLDGVANGYEYPFIIDQSGNGYNSDTQATATKRANYVSTGGPVSGYAEFDGDDKYIMRTAIPTFTFKSVLLIFRAPVTLQPLDGIINTRLASGNAWISAGSNGAGLNRHFSNTWSYAESQGVNVTTAFNEDYTSPGWLYPVGGWTYLWLKGGMTTATGFDICTDSGGREPLIDIAEICVWDTDLTAQEEEEMKVYLSNINGIATS